MKTPDWKIKYVYKGELLEADEFIKAQDEIIKDLKKQLEQKDGQINVLNGMVRETLNKLNQEAKEKEDLQVRLKNIRERELKKNKIVPTHLQDNK